MHICESVCMSMCVCMCVCIAETYFVCSKGRVETYILVYVRTRHRHCPSHYFINDLPQNLNIYIFSSIAVCNFGPLITKFIAPTTVKLTPSVIWWG